MDWEEIKEVLYDTWKPVAIGVGIGITASLTSIMTYNNIMEEELIVGDREYEVSQFEIPNEGLFRIISGDHKGSLCGYDSENDQVKQVTCILDDGTIQYGGPCPMYLDY